MLHLYIDDMRIGNFRKDTFKMVFLGCSAIFVKNFIKRGQILI